MLRKVNSTLNRKDNTYPSISNSKTRFHPWSILSARSIPQASRGQIPVSSSLACSRSRRWRSRSRKSGSENTSGKGERNKRGYVCRSDPLERDWRARGHCAIVALQRNGRQRERERDASNGNSNFWLRRHKQLWQMPGYVNRARQILGCIVCVSPWSAVMGNRTVSRHRFFFSFFLF